MNKQSILYKTLQRALSKKRPHDTEAIDFFVTWLFEKLPVEFQNVAEIDGAGNLHVDTRVDTSNKTLFVAHIDTVHSAMGKNKIRKTATHWYADGDVLGADDGAGCALLMHLIHAGVPAYYIFTQGEERGGIGAKYLAKHHEALLSTFDRAIAFDRRGIDSVITHQGYGRCCSDAFGEALAFELCKSNDNMMHLNDDTGIYTDTAEFTDTIPECTNISVGYQSEHTQKESLDLRYYQALAEAVVLVDWDNLPTKRDPSVPDPDDKWAKYTAWDYADDVTGDNSGVSWWDKKTVDNTKYNFANAYDYAAEELYDALNDALYGYYDALMYMIAEVAYPDDPEMCVRHMNPKMLDHRALENAIALSDCTDRETVLLGLFDAAHVA